MGLFCDHDWRQDGRSGGGTFSRVRYWHKSKLFKTREAPPFLYARSHYARFNYKSIENISNFTFENICHSADIERVFEVVYYAKI